MVLVLVPVGGQPLEVLELPCVSQSSQFCQAVDSTTLPVSVNTDQVANASAVPGATCSSALDNLQNRIAALNTDEVANASSVAGASTTDALNELAELIAATASAPGYTSRFAFVHASSTKIGTSFAGVTCQAAVTWNTATDVPPGNTFTWDVWASAGGAAGGKASFTGSGLQSHGAPSAGSAHRRFVCSRADVLAALPLVIAPGLGGVGSVGAFRAPPDGAGSTLPLSPGNGQASTVGSLCSAFPGGAGRVDPLAAPPTRSGSSGGGTQSAGGQGTSTAVVPGGNPGAPQAGATGEGGAGCTGAGGGGNGASGAEHGGASCTASGTATTNYGPGGTSAYGGSAGGWGAACNTGVSAATNGGPGGGPLGGSPGVSAVADNVSCTATGGTDGGDGSLTRGASAGAGGGSAKVGNVTGASTGVVATAGPGGDGGFPGGGAGGGGDAALGILGVPGAGCSARGGDGGTGGDGLVLLTISS